MFYTISALYNLQWINQYKLYTCTLISVEVLALDTELLGAPVQEHTYPGKWCIYLGAIARKFMGDVPSLQLALHLTPLLSQLPDDYKHMEDTD